MFWSRDAEMLFWSRDAEMVFWSQMLRCCFGYEMLRCCFGCITRSLWHGVVSVNTQFSGRLSLFIERL
eukprot:1160382-Pelagomonas_calceolata.AAC.4